MLRTNAQPTDVEFSDATMLPAEGARVGLVTCNVCGAAILLDPREPISEQERHRNWHLRNDLASEQDA